MNTLMSMLMNEHLGFGGKVPQEDQGAHVYECDILGVQGSRGRPAFPHCSRCKKKSRFNGQDAFVVVSRFLDVLTGAKKPCSKAWL
jgi:hypothetical protein